MEIEGTWTVRLTAAAERDFESIVAWTNEQFGSRQARTYAEQLISTLIRLTEGPGIIGAKARNDITEGICTLHMGSKGRHFVLFRSTATAQGRRSVEVLRILHEAMDLARHLPANGQEP